MIPHVSRNHGQNSYQADHAPGILVIKHEGEVRVE